MKFIMYFISAVATSMVLTACGGSGDSSIAAPSHAGRSAQISEKYQGVWLAPAYGKGYRLGESSLEAFDYTAGFCVLTEKSAGVNDDEIEEVFYLSESGLENFGDLGTLEFHAPTEVYSKAMVMPEACNTGFAPQIGDADYQADAIKDLDLFFELFNEYSISIEAKNVDWIAGYQAAKAAVRSDTSNLEMIEVFYQMIAPLADIHTSVLGNEGFTKVENKTTQPYLYAEEFMALNNLSSPLSPEEVAENNHYIDTQLTLHDAIVAGYAEDESDIKTAANGMLRWFTVDSVGYLNIVAMTGFADLGDNEASLAALEQALDAALLDLQETDGLIVDVRTNGGGQDFLSLAIASRFVATQTHVYRKQAGLMQNLTEMVDVYISPRGQYQYLKPVVLLVSASTVSAAETFALTMSSLDNVVIMGEASQGGFSDILPKTLLNGFKVNLSNERYLSITNEWYEGTGVPVDIEVPVFTLEEREDEFDAAIEAAAQLLIQ